jgi:integrase/recombinase XerD
MTTLTKPTLSTHLHDYLLLRNRLGHDLADAARLLPRFVSYLDAVGHSTITITDAIDWTQSVQASADSSVWPRRMTAVRGFARFLSGIDSATEIPPLGIFPSHQQWRPPFLFSTKDSRSSHCCCVDALAATRRDLLDAVRTSRSDRDAVW